MNSIGKKFWFFPADCILQKAHEIEKQGQALHNLISKHRSFEADFYLDATIEEAVSSAIYEGANSTRAKAQQLIESGNMPITKDEWMLVNNFKAMQWIKENSEKRVTNALILDVHEIVTRNTLTGDDINFSEEFRNDKVFVHSRANEIKHEGISHELVEATLQEAIALTTANSRYFPPLLKGILLHYFIAYIHPFFDGNGRTARTLFYFKAIKNNLRFVELLSVSAYLKNHGLQYERSFETVIKNDLDITYFINFNLDALKKAIQRVAEKFEYLIQIPRLQEAFKLFETQIAMLQRTALRPFRKLDIESYSKTIDRSREVARQELKRLHELGLMREKKEGKKYIYTIDREKLRKAVGEAAKRDGTIPPFPKVT